MKSDLLSAIKQERDVTDVLVLTHNIDFVFLQSVVLSTLRKCGNPSLTVLADAGCALESYERQAPVLKHLGHRFRVVPVPMDPHFRFHPKAILLTGNLKATLFVGSGNLTFGGWRENGEVWLRFDTDEDPTGQVAEFQAYLERVLSQLPLPDAVLDDVEEAFDPSQKTWVTDLGEPGGLVGRVGTGAPLLEGILAEVGPGPVDELIVCSPYFDDGGNALGQLLDVLAPSSTRVFLQNDRTGFPKAAVGRFSERVRFEAIDFLHTDKEGSERHSFVHAKFYAVRRGDRVTVFAGSANCSVAALTLSGRAGNAELLAIQELDASDFQEAYLQDLEFPTGPPRIPEPKEEKVGEPLPVLRVLAARLEGTRLSIGFQATEGVEISACLVDGIAAAWHLDGVGTAVAEVTTDARSVVLRGSLSGTEISSQPMWVDHEGALATRSHHRTFRQAVRKSFSPESWNLGAWSEVMEVFLRNLEFMPRARRRTTTSAAKDGEDSPQKTIEFSETDVFSPTYGLRPSPPLLNLGSGDTVEDLGQLLLRWFSWDDKSEEEEPTEEGQDPDDAGPKGEDGEEPVDGLEKFPPPKPPRKKEKIKPTEKELKRARRVIEKVVSRLVDPEFRNHRPPESLAVDLKIVAILLRTALAEAWLSEEEFFTATERIWKPLFFSAEEGETRGWLELRYSEAEDPSEFADRMASAELSAAMAAWAFAVPPKIQNAQEAAFHLVATLAVARVPWLWRGGPENGISAGLDQLLALTTGPGQVSDMPEFRSRWLDLMRQGEAFRRLEACVMKRPLGDLREEITQATLKAGELLWQGERGFCVVREDALRDAEHKVSVLTLQGMVEEKKFRGDFTIPLSGLAGILKGDRGLGTNEAKVLRALLRELQRGFRGFAIEKAVGKFS